MPGLKDANTELAWKFIRKMAKEMSGFSDDDGLGYAAIDGEGKLFGERWFSPKEAFLNREEKGMIAEEVIKRYKGFVKGKLSVYNNFGDVHDKSLRSIMLHARNATNEKSLRNTHPFVIDGTALIHNGVISNDDMLIKKISSCDSEVILNEYLRLNVVNNIKKIDEVAARLNGYYAVGVMGKQKNGRLILDVFKDSVARLRGYFIKELDTIVFTTPGQSDNYGPIQTVCREMNLTIIEEFELEDGVLLRLDAMTGETIDSFIFDTEFRDKTVEKKKKPDGNNSNGGNTNNGHHRTNEDAQGILHSVFRAGEGSNKSQRSFAERQKDEELERELIDGISYCSSYEETDLNKDTPPLLPEGSTSRFNINDDWEEKEDGFWTRRASSAV